MPGAAGPDPHGAWSVQQGQSTAPSRPRATGARLKGSAQAWTLPTLHGDTGALMSSGGSPAIIDAFRYAPYRTLASGGEFHGTGSVDSPWRHQGRLLAAGEDTAHTSVGYPMMPGGVDGYASRSRRMNLAMLPNTGRIRYVPPKGYSGAKPFAPRAEPRVHQSLR